MEKDKSQPTHDPSGDRRRVDEIEAQLREARLRDPKPTAQNGAGNGPGSGMSHRQLGVAYRVLVDMIAGLLVGGFLGYWLDRWLGSQPYSLIVGLLVGFAAGVNNAWRAIRVYTAQAEGEQNNRLP
jgi:ATP synthase protein I